MLSTGSETRAAAIPPDAISISSASRPACLAYTGINIGQVADAPRPWPRHAEKRCQAASRLASRVVPADPMEEVTNADNDFDAVA